MDKGARGVKRLRETEVGGDEGTALRVGQDAARRRIGERIGVEKDARLAEREIVKRAERRAT